MTSMNLDYHLLAVVAKVTCPSLGTLGTSTRERWVLTRSRHWDMEECWTHDVAGVRPVHTSEDGVVTLRQAQL